jgi:diguanylate cyclase (GGDEF)-like protein
MRMNSHRRTVGRVAGVAMTVSALAALASILLLSNRNVPPSFGFAVAASFASGVVSVFVPWDEIPAYWLHALPIVATVQTAVGIRLAGTFGDIAANYYIFIAVFAAYAFSSRRAVVAHVTLAAAASMLPLLYHGYQGGLIGARIATGLLTLIVVSGIVTVLREGLEERRHELEQLAARDPLTGVGNYRLMSERLDYEIARHRRTGRAFSVLLLDLDGFKAVNDTFGHLVGDNVLIEVARALTGSVRAQDTVARQGGDEFSILAPETGAEDSEQLALRVERAVAAAAAGAVTTCVGRVTFPHDATEPAALLALADADLRRAKERRGPDRTTRRGEGQAVSLHLVERPAG